MAGLRSESIRRVLRVLALTIAGWAALTVLVVIALRWIHPPTTAFMLRDRLVALVSRDNKYEVRYEWRDWDQISRQAALAVVSSEDQRFPEHHGFDFKQIDRALEDRERGRRVRGASTISQQVAKNLFLWPGHSWIRKGLEAAITVLIETFWPKQRILEMYLNIAEFGRGTFGVQAASRRFFHKDAKRLTSSEAALLAAVLPAPKRFHVEAPSRYVQRRQRWIQHQMGSLGGTGFLVDLQ